VRLRRQHHVIELLREHRRREEGDRPQRVLADIGEVVMNAGRQHKDAWSQDAWSVHIRTESR
jgi:hypothetical protein